MLITRLLQERLKEEEMFVKLSSILDDIKLCEAKNDYENGDDLPPVHIPTSPSISLQVYSVREFI